MEYTHKNFNDKLHDVFYVKVLLLQNALKLDGHVFYLHSGFRGEAEQTALWQQGRNKFGKVIDKAKVVTNAKFGSSYHNYGLACDLVYDENGGKGPFKPSWKREHYEILAKKAVGLGLDAGHYWKSFPDSPHVQLPLATLKELFAAHQKGGDKAVKELLDSKL